MKRIVTTLCALAVIMVGSIPAMAAEEPPRQDASYYPISVDEYTYGELEEPRINKVYQLSLSDDPSLIPTEDFERDGLWFTLLDMTRKNEVGVDTQPYTETVTRPSKTNDMAQVLQALEAEMEVTTAEGYAGTLHLDHTSVQVKTDGYATKTNNLSATRSYPNLSDADVSLVPKSIEDKGKTLTLADVQWSEAQYSDGAGGTVTRYTATASYTGTSTSRYATGYTVTANYTGEVAKTGCDMVTYTAIFGSTEAPEEVPMAEGAPGAETPSQGVDLSALKQPLLAGGVILALAVGVCASMGVVAGYGDGRFGSDDPVSPQMACTIMLRYLERDGWTYVTACGKAVELGLAQAETLEGETITRGDMALLLTGSLDYLAYLQTL